MSVKISVDNRENQLITILNDKTVDFDIKQLELGDITLCDEDDNTILIIERKTLNDLSASICDGRLREQRTRLLANYNPNRILYIIEGDIRKNSRSVNTDTLIGSMINMQLRDNISVYRTMNTLETANYLIKLSKKISKDGSTYFNNTCENITVSQYCSTIKTKKKSNMTPDVWFITQFALLPNITEQIAEAILMKYKSMSLLVIEYEKTEESKRHLLLVDITYVNKNNNTKKIGIKNSEKIYKHIYNITD
jgi:ERCC4-type nuclease